MDHVVAVLHEHAAPVAELHREGTLTCRAQPVHGLPALLPRRNYVGIADPVAAPPAENLALLEVDVDRMVPATVGIPQGPDLARTEPRLRRDPAEVGREHLPQVG